MSVFVDRTKTAHSYRDYLNFLKEMGEMIDDDPES